MWVLYNTDCDLIKWEQKLHVNKTISVLHLTLKFCLKEKGILKVSIVYPRCFNIPNQSILTERFPNNLIILK